jgi:hypothetical protein
MRLVQARVEENEARAKGDRRGPQPEGRANPMVPGPSLAIQKSKAPK